MHHDKVVGGFAGSTADAFALFARFEEKLEKFQGNLPRSAVELAKDWRTDKMLRRLEAMLIVVDKEHSLDSVGMGYIISENIPVFAGLRDAFTGSSPNKKIILVIVEEAMKITASICIYTNSNITIEEL